MIVLADFTGRWALSRRIDDALTGQAATLEGEAVFSDDGAGLCYDEAGELRLAGQPPVRATRRYFWRQDGDAIVVSFDDGRAFHRFRPDAEVPGDTHACAPDTYLVRYDFTDWPRWQAVWHVSGPRKAYCMTSFYQPCPAPIARAETQDTE